LARTDVRRHRAEGQGHARPRGPGPALQSGARQGSRHTLDDGTPAHSFATLLAELATIVRNTCHTPKAGADAPTFEVLTTPNPKQQLEQVTGGA
jgi:hypothetical protein